MKTLRSTPAGLPGPARCPSCAGPVDCQIEAAQAGGRCWCFDLPSEPPVGATRSLPAPASRGCWCRACLSLARAPHASSPSSSAA